MLSIITEDQTELWDEIVKGFENYDVYYLSGYPKGFQLHGDGEPILFFYKDKNIKAINVVMKRDIEKDKNFIGKIPKHKYFDIATPYGYGGWIIEGKIEADTLECLDSEYCNFCKNNGILTEFVRFHPIFKNSNVLDGIYDILKLGNTIAINLDSKELVWSNFTSSSRNKVRKAQKTGVEIFYGNNMELYRQFINLYNNTMDRDNAKEYYYFKEEFYNSIRNDLKNNAFMFYAVFQEKIIAMAIILFANQQMHYHLSALDKDYRSFAPMNLLLYEAALWGCDNGYKTFHLGGGLGGSEDNLYKFKSSFNRKSNYNFKIGKKIFDTDKYNYLIELRREISGDNTVDKFFPKYRACIE